MDDGADEIGAGWPEIPYLDLGEAGAHALMDREPERALALLEAGRAAHGAGVVALLDGWSRRWLARAENPYGHEIDAVAARVEARGAHFLNMSYEWGCSTAVAADPGGPGSRMLRTLDWPLRGIGRHVVVARHKGPAGVYDNVTWPGFVGVMTAMAPGRFSAAINQAPMRRRGLPRTLDWAANRIGQWRSRAIPPAHLLRRVFETCASYAEAREALTTTPICLPAIFSLSGAEAGEGSVIERLEARAEIHEGPISVANHWITERFRGSDRGTDSHARRAHIAAFHEAAGAGPGFDWLTPPVLNPTTRIVAVMNAARGQLRLQGYEDGSPVTQVFERQGDARKSGPNPLTGQRVTL